MRNQDSVKENTFYLRAAQEAYALTTGEHSIFTYYLIQGLKGNTESVDNEGNVTPQSLGRYVYRAIMSLPPEKRPKQTPFTRAEGSGDLILAPHPEFARKAQCVNIKQANCDLRWLSFRGRNYT
jgi:hypothetical protein